MAIEDGGALGRAEEDLCAAARAALRGLLGMDGHPADRIRGQAGDVGLRGERDRIDRDRLRDVLEGLARPALEREPRQRVGPAAACVTSVISTSPRSATAATRAARLTAAPNQSPSRCTAGPVWAPTRTPSDPCRVPTSPISRTASSIAGEASGTRTITASPMLLIARRRTRAGARRRRRRSRGPRRRPSRRRAPPSSRRSRRDRRTGRCSRRCDECGSRRTPPHSLDLHDCRVGRA